MNFSGLISMIVYFCVTYYVMELFAEVISEIQGKVSALKEQLSKVNTDNERMVQTIAVLEKRLEEKQTELNDAHSKIKELSVEVRTADDSVKAVTNNLDQEDIEALVQEIDDCIIRLKNK